MDLRFTTPFAETQTCGVDPEFPGGPEEAKLIIPSDLARSILALRIAEDDAGDVSMPPIGAHQVDIDALGWIREWIYRMESCD